MNDDVRDWPPWREEALMGRMRLGEESAFHEYLARYEPVLHDVAIERRYYRRGGPDIVLQALDAVAERIRTHRLPRGARLGPYLVCAMRNLVIDRWRAARSRERAERDAATALDGLGEAAVRSACSAYTLRLVRAPDTEEDEDMDDAVRAFHDYIESLLTPDERRILGWLGEWVSQREIAEWTGAGHGATRMRIQRLRRRVLAAAKQYLAGLDRDTREHLERLYLRQAAHGPAGEEDES